MEKLYRGTTIKPVELPAGFRNAMNFNHDLDSFYQSTEWKRKREAILARDNYQCQECRRYGKLRQAVTVHHKQHLEDHPELAFDNDNLISLCRACHDKAHPEKGTKSLELKRSRYRSYY